MAFGPAQTRSIPGAVATIGVDERISFIRKTYGTLAVAVVAFVLTSFALHDSGFSERMFLWALGGSMVNWLIVLGGFMLTGYIADKWARSDFSRGVQFVGLGLAVVSYAVVFAPLLFMAAEYSDKSVIPNAAALTLLLFGGLTGTVFITKKDFSFMGGALRLASFAALGVILLGMISGFTLGLFFALLMVALCAGYVLYYTSQILAHYRPTQWVAASLALFGAIAMMFYYVVVVVMNMSRD